MANKKEPVGYKRPPSHSRFKAGQSGNPRGSSKKARSSKGIFSEIEFANMGLDELRKPISYLHNGKRVTTTRYQAIIARCASDALAGKSGAQRLSLEIATKASEAKAQHHREETKTYAEVKRMQEKEWASQVNAGIAEPQVFPHPEDIWFDDGLGIAVCDGAFDAETDKQFKQIVECRDKLISLGNSSKILEEIEEDKNFVHSMRKTLAMLESKLPRRLRLDYQKIRLEI